MKQKHHNIFQTTEQGQLVLKICPIQAESCFVCSYILKEYNLQDWEKQSSLDDCEHLYYLSFDFDIETMGNQDILNCFNETLTETLLNSSTAITNFIISNSFGLSGYFHPKKDDFNLSSMTFEIVSTIPYPNDLIRNVSRKVNQNYFLCECDFSFGSIAIVNESYLRKSNDKKIERSLSLLKTEDYPSYQLNTFYTIVSAGLTPLKFTEQAIVNRILNREILVV